MRVKEWLSRGGSRGSEETGANSGMRERSGGVLFWPLSFLVFLVVERREEAARQDGGGNLSCGRDAFPQLVEVTKGCGEREWRELVD